MTQNNFFCLSYFFSISYLVHIVSFKQLHLKLSWDILYFFTFFENYLDVINNCSLQ